MTSPPSRPCSIDETKHTAGEPARPQHAPCCSNSTAISDASKLVIVALDTFLVIVKSLPTLRWMLVVMDWLFRLIGWWAISSRFPFLLVRHLPGWFDWPVVNLWNSIPPVAKEMTSVVIKSQHCWVWDVNLTPMFVWLFFTIVIFLRR